MILPHVPNDTNAAAYYAGCTRVDGFSGGNRGLNYGDGLFETMRIHRGEVPLWPRHLARLREGARRLGITLPDVAYIGAQVGEIVQGREVGVLKLLLTRGDGGRGYAPAPDATSAWMLSLHDLPPSRAGLRVHWCALRLAAQPALAGIKHCNRLEQVLARMEAERAGCDEGLVQDGDGHVVSATAANLLVRSGDRWLTPPVDRCGVAGVVRGWLLDQGLLEVRELERAEVEVATALALCNGVRGILPVVSLGSRVIAPEPALDELQGRLAMAYPMFSGTAGDP